MLAYQKLMRDAMSSQLSALNLPTRDDVGRLGELVVSLEEKVDQLDERIDQLVERVDELVHKTARLEAQMTIQAEQQAADNESSGAEEGAAERGSKPAAARANRAAVKGGKTD